MKRRPGKQTKTTFAKSAAPAYEPGNPGRPRGYRLTTQSSDTTDVGGRAGGAIIIDPKGSAGLVRAKAGGTIIINPKGGGKKGVRGFDPIHGRILNCVPSREVEKDWQIEHARAAGLLRAAPAIPESRDWREAWWAINDQGQTGSCVGWAAADGVIRWHLVKSNRIGQDSLLSARFLWMSAKETDEFTDYPSTFIELEGTSLKAALDIARKFGNLADADLPFNGSLWQGEPEVLFSHAAQLRIASYYNLGRDLQKWKEWLANHGPILTRLEVDATWVNVQTDGVLQTYDASQTYGGHAVAMVGYTPGTIIVRNSWGTSWGNGGFAHASNSYALAAFTEAYGIA